MATFDEILVEGATLQLSEFGEEVFYRPAAGGTRAITAIVIRQPPVLADRPRAETTPLRVQTRNDATVGITTSEWTHRDTLSVRPHLGGALKELRIIRPVGEDAGLVTWEVG